MVTVELVGGGRTFVLTAGDTYPPLRAMVVDGSIVPDRAKFRLTRNGDEVFERRATVTDSGELVYEWRRGQTADPGLYRATFSIRDPTGRRATTNRLTVVIER